MPALKNLLFILVLFIHQACRMPETSISTPEEHPPPQYTFEFGKSTWIKLKYSHANSPVILTSSHWNTFPMAEFNIEPDTLRGSGERMLLLEVNKAEEIFLLFNREELRLFVLPDDTLQLSVDFSSPAGIAKGVSFSGKLANINKYFSQRSTLIPSIARATITHRAKDLYELSSRNDSLTKITLKFLSDYHARHPLPQWFLTYEQNSILYENAAFQMNGKFYRKYVNKITEETPTDFYSFTDSLPLNNQAAMITQQYFTYVWEYFGWKLNRYPRKLSEAENVKQYEQLLSFAAENLEGETKDAFMARALVMWINCSTCPQKEHIVRKFEPRFTGPKYIDFVLNYFNNRSRLHQGDQAPGFSLVDTSDRLVSLSEFKGKYVLIGFWFSGCAPCIAEFPYENKLVEKYKGKPITFINVCFDSPKEQWLRKVNKHNLQTLNLYCSGNWNQKIKKEYFIIGTPRYVLIDKQGKIIDDNCRRPSAGLDALLDSIINE